MRGGVRGSGGGPRERCSWDEGFRGGQVLGSAEASPLPQLRAASDIDLLDSPKGAGPARVSKAGACWAEDKSPVPDRG